MHPSSLLNMQRLIAHYLLPSGVLGAHARVLDVGGRGLDSDRSYLPWFRPHCREYSIADICEGLGVTHVMPGPFELPFPDNTFDVVVSGQMLEHSANPFKSMAEMKRVCRVGGYLAIIAPSAGPRHDTQDGWRFMNDAFRFIVEDIGGVETIVDYIDITATDERSAKWKDHIFLGRKRT